MRSSSTIRMDPISNGKCPYKRKAERPLGHTEKRRLCEERGRNWRYAATRNAGSHEKWEEARKVSLLELLEEAWPCQHLDSRLLASQTVR